MFICLVKERGSVSSSMDSSAFFRKPHFKSILIQFNITDIAEKNIRRNILKVHLKNMSLKTLHLHFSTCFSLNYNILVLVLTPPSGCIYGIISSMNFIPGVEGSKPVKI